MKKLILLLALTTVAFQVQSQCTPDPSQTAPGIHPDSAAGFADACVNMPYSQLITNVVPADTNVVVFGIPIQTSIDSIVIDSLHGLPPGMVLNCSPASCTFLGGATGCATITGTCTVAGTNNLTFYLSAYVGGVSSANGYVVDYYKIIVQSAPCTAGIKEEEIQTLRVAPNPTNTNAVLQGLNGKKGVSSVTLSNIEGKTIASYPINGENEINIMLAPYNNGVYFIQILSAEGIETLKLIKE